MAASTRMCLVALACLGAFACAQNHGKQDLCRQWLVVAAHKLLFSCKHTNTGVTTWLRPSELLLAGSACTSPHSLSVAFLSPDCNALCPAVSDGAPRGAPAPISAPALVSAPAHISAPAPISAPALLNAPAPKSAPARPSRPATPSSATSDGPPCGLRAPAPGWARGSTAACCCTQTSLPAPVLASLPPAARRLCAAGQFLPNPARERFRAARPR